MISEFGPMPALNPSIWPVLIVGIASIACGLLVLRRERGSAVGVTYCLATSAAGIWLLGYVGTYLSTTPAQAQTFIRLSHVGVCFIAPALYHFAVALLNLRGGYRAALSPMWAFGTIFASVVMFGDGFLLPPYRYSWGYYAHYGWIGSLFVGGLCAILLTMIHGLWRAQRLAVAGSVEQRRARLLLLAFSVGSTAAVDFLPAYGIALHPIGSAMVLFLVTVVGYTTWRYRLVSITPALAAPQIIETMRDMLIVLDPGGTIRLVNPRARELLRHLGARPEGDPIDQVLPELEFEAHRRALAEDGIYDGGELSCIGLDGRPLYLSVSVALRRDDEGRPVAYVCVLHDVTAVRDAAEQIHRLAYFDSVTELPNPQLFHERLRTILADATREHRRVAVLFIDLDRFKRVNDVLGRASGDVLLRLVARRLHKELADKSASLIGHFGGDEFSVALGYTDRESLDETLHRLLLALETPFVKEGLDLSISASIGVSCFPEDGADAQLLTSKADAAMDQAKQAGRHGYCFFDATVSAAMTRRLMLETELVRALDQNQFELHYQPQIDARSGAVIGAEALLRWRHPTLGNVPPAEFIPVAESTGLIIPIGARVLRQACQDALRWRRQLGRSLRVAVNVSGVQFSGTQGETLLRLVAHILKETGMDPASLELELTESVVMQRGEQAVTQLAALKALGVRLSIDDFGTGYSSLSYLTRFPIDMLKIDQSFVRELPGSANQQTVLRTIIAMARSLDLELIAEGVETRAHVDFLIRHNCHLMQGYHFAGPLPSPEMDAFLANNNAPDGEMPTPTAGAAFSTL